MKLSDVLSLNKKLTIPLLQEAYYDIIDKIKLDLYMFPVMMEDNACRLGGFEYPAVKVDGNIIAFKEIPFMHNVAFDTTKDYEYANNSFVIGDYKLEFAGFDETKFNNCNTEHTDICHIYNSNHEFVCNNFDDLVYPMFVIFGYAYPLPVYESVTADLSKSIGTHTSYDIATIMLEGAGILETELEMIDKLVPMIVAKALSIKYNQDGNISEATHYDYITAQYVNMYNESVENIIHSMPNNMGAIWQQS